MTSLRRVFLASAALPLAAVAAAPVSEKPNILVILADDLGYGDLGCTGSSQIKTPRIDALAGESVVCEQGYTAAPVCAPSRMGLLTGRTPAMMGTDHNLSSTVPGYDGEFNGMDVKQTTVADRLKAAGYTTAVIGKWHLGDKPQFHPKRRGFDHFHGFLAGSREYFPTKREQASGKCDMESTFGPVPPVTYLTDDLAKAGADFIRARGDKPFFLYMAFNAPHAPLQATEADLAPYAHINNKGRRTYCAMVAGLDRGVGVLLDALKASGADRNTLVVFMSDNGSAGEANMSCGAPFNGMKGTVLEGGIRTPFFVRWPAKFAPRKLAAPVTALDLLPTFVAAAGGTVEPDAKLDGRDITGWLAGTETPGPRDLFWRFHGANAIRSGDLKLIDVAHRLPMVFDLAKDAGERADLFRSRLDDAESLKRKLGRKVLACPDLKYSEGASWAAYQADLYDKFYSPDQPAPDGVWEIRKAPKRP